MRRHLGYSVSEWQDLPWHQQRMYMDGLIQEFVEGRSDEPAPQDDLSTLDLASVGPEQLARAGFGVGRAG